MRFQSEKKNKVRKNKMENDADVKRCGEWLW